MATPSFVQVAAIDLVKMLADEIDTQASATLKANAANLAYTPGPLATAVRDAIREITDPALLDALARDALKDAPHIPLTTSSRRIQERNQDALRDLARGIAAAELARAAKNQTYTARLDASESRHNLTARIDERAVPANPETYLRLRELLGAYSRHISEVLKPLPEVVNASPTAVLPSLVFSYQIYGGIERADEIASRNRLTRPGFVPARPLEIIQP